MSSNRFPQVAMNALVALCLLTTGARSLRAAEPAPSAQVAMALADLREGSPFAILAAQDLGELRAVEATGELVRWARGDRTGEKLIRIAALEALGKIGGEEARRALEQVAADGTAGDVRLYAIRALAPIGDGASLEALAAARTTAPNMLTEDAIDQAVEAISRRIVS